MAIRRRGEVQGQLAMFMTPREIHAQYQPLDADREGREETRWTDRPRAPEGSRGYGRTTGGGHYYRDRVTTSTVHVSHEVPETDEQLWSRKYDEAQMTPEERYQEVGGERQSARYINEAGDTTKRSGQWEHVDTWTTSGSDTGHFTQRSTFRPHEEYPEGGPSLVEHIRKHGMPGMISLGQEEGSMGKPQIVGGHHRLAVMTQHHPDRLIPVLHHESIHAARGGGRVSGDVLRRAGYGYT